MAADRAIVDKCIYSGRGHSTELCRCLNIGLSIDYLTILYRRRIGRSAGKSTVVDASTIAQYKAGRCFEHAMKHFLFVLAMLASTSLPACGEDSSDSSDEAPGVVEDAEARVGFEIFQLAGSNEIVVWLGLDLTLEAFNVLDLPQGWLKNEPRETEPDGGTFIRSPDAAVDGMFTDAEHFGHSWRYNATVIEAGTPIDDEGLLRLNRVAKFHEVRFDAGRTLFILVSPEGEHFVRISRDVNRTIEVPTLPVGWQLVEQALTEPLVFDLPNPTLNIRCDNEDSFQGPVTELSDL